MNKSPLEIHRTEQIPRICQQFEQNSFVAVRDRRTGCVCFDRVAGGDTATPTSATNAPFEHSSPSTVAGEGATRKTRRLPDAPSFSDLEPLIWSEEGRKVVPCDSFTRAGAAAVAASPTTTSSDIPVGSALGEEPNLSSTDLPAATVLANKVIRGRVGVVLSGNNSIAAGILNVIIGLFAYLKKNQESSGSDLVRAESDSQVGRSALEQHAANHPSLLLSASPVLAVAATGHPASAETGSSAGALDLDKTRSSAGVVVQQHHPHSGAGGGSVSSQKQKNADLPAEQRENSLERSRTWAPRGGLEPPDTSATILPGEGCTRGANGARIPGRRSAVELVGYVGGPKGFIEGRCKRISEWAQVKRWLNQGGCAAFSYSPVENLESPAAVLQRCQQDHLQHLVMIGGPQCVLWARRLAPLLAAEGIQLVFVPKSKNLNFYFPYYMPLTLGFDSSRRMLSEVVGNIAVDVLSSRKYWHFIRCGDAALTLELACNVRATVAILTEDVFGISSVPELIRYLADVVEYRRIVHGHWSGIVLLSDGLLERHPDMFQLRQEIAQLDHVVFEHQDERQSAPRHAGKPAEQESSAPVVAASSSSSKREQEQPTTTGSLPSPSPEGAAFCRTPSRGSKHGSSRPSHLQFSIDAEAAPRGSTKACLPDTVTEEWVSRRLSFKSQELFMILPEHVRRALCFRRDALGQPMLPEDLRAEKFFGTAVRKILERRVEALAVEARSRMTAQEQLRINWAMWSPTALSCENRFRKVNGGRPSPQRPGVTSETRRGPSLSDGGLRTTTEAATTRSPAFISEGGEGQKALASHIGLDRTAEVARLHFSPRYWSVSRESAGALPTPFDCHLGWTLGHCAGALLANGLTGHIASCAELVQDVGEWRPCGVPIDRFCDFDHTTAVATLARNPMQSDSSAFQVAAQGTEARFFGTMGTVTRANLRNLYKTRFEPLWRDHNFFRAPGPLQFRATPSGEMHPSFDLLVRQGSHHDVGRSVKKTAALTSAGRSDAPEAQEKSSTFSATIPSASVADLPLTLLAENLSSEKLAELIQPSALTSSGYALRIPPASTSEITAVGSSAGGQVPAFAATDSEATAQIVEDEQPNEVEDLALRPQLPSVSNVTSPVKEFVDTLGMLTGRDRNPAAELPSPSSSSGAWIYNSESTKSAQFIPAVDAPPPIDDGKKNSEEKFSSGAGPHARHPASEDHHPADVDANQNLVTDPLQQSQPLVSVSVRGFDCLSPLEQERVRYEPELPDVLKQPMQVVEEMITARMSFQVEAALPLTAHLPAIAIHPVKPPLTYDEAEEHLLAKADPDEIADSETLWNRTAADGLAAPPSTTVEAAFARRDVELPDSALAASQAPAIMRHVNSGGHIEASTASNVPFVDPSAAGADADSKVAVPRDHRTSAPVARPPVSVDGTSAGFGVVDALHQPRTPSHDGQLLQPIGGASTSGSSPSQRALAERERHGVLRLLGSKAALPRSRDPNVVNQYPPPQIAKNFSALQDYAEQPSSPTLLHAHELSRNLSASSAVDVHQLHPLFGAQETPTGIGAELVGRTPRNLQQRNLSGALENENYKEMSQLVKQHTLANSTPVSIGVMFGSHQAPGFHSVVAGLFDYVSSMDPPGRLVGFVGGWVGLKNGWVRSLDAQKIASVRNLGGQELLCEFGHTLQTDEDYSDALQTLRRFQLDALVVVGNLKSQLDTALLAEACLADEELAHIRVLGIPVASDNDFPFIQQSIGFDTVTKVFASIAGSLWCEAATSRKQWFFVRVKGESQALSHVTLETALLCHPNLVLLSEEMAHKRLSLLDLTRMICDVIVARASRNLHFGIVLLPSALLRSVPQTRHLLEEIEGILRQIQVSTSLSSADGASNFGQAAESGVSGPSQHSTTSSAAAAFSATTSNPTTTATAAALGGASGAAQERNELLNHLKTWSRALFQAFPRTVQEELCSNVSPSTGVIDLNNVSTEVLLATLVGMEIERRRKLDLFKGHFETVPHTLVYQARSGMPTNFDCNLAYTMGFAAGVLQDAGKTGYLVHAGNLCEPPSQWTVGGIPFTSMVCLQNGVVPAATQDHVVARKEVYMPSANQQGSIYGELLSSRNMPPPIERSYINAGPIQFAYDFLSRMLVTARRAPFEKLQEVGRMCTEFQRAIANDQRKLFPVLDCLQGAARLLREVDQSQRKADGAAHVATSGDWYNRKNKSMDTAADPYQGLAMASSSSVRTTGAGPEAADHLLFSKGGSVLPINVPASGKSSLSLADLVQLSPRKAAALLQIMLTEATNTVTL
ncbi:unnamed protein product [Amoebophrya sp. A120]|nr:unnamed protein product [Amoebophrya sp. A120]|eukprot:GSA120T00015256001.1